MRDETRGTLLILITAFISGIAIVINKFFVVKIDPLFFTAIRALFIGLIFLAISLFIARSKPGKVKKFKKVSWKYLISIGIIGGSLAFWLFFTGLKLTTAGRAAFIHKTLPVFVLILAFVFLKEKITKKQLGAIGIMILGLILIELTKVQSAIRIGDLLVLGATFLWAIENTLSKKVMLEKESNWVVTFSRMFFGSLVLFSIIFISGKTSLLFSLNLQQILYIAISGTFLLFYVLTWYWGLRYINLSKASTILLIAPVISLVLGFIWLNEQIFILQLIGSALILVGAYIVIKTKSERRI
ncbi:MAG TPA: DMT family transporter [Candidatus Pacearchaeota archaeon]|nr:putative amino-acid metabolite efflux pump [archaeon BMS3Abin17]HDK42311.1 DMT family transporter [Candidatus Pacearchaeota archaeon]HDZ61314.1 DMT family transporter [Candidatus Pacearchaeota archaeon]